MQEVYLEMVTSQNNNKYYHMIEKGDGTFEALYGRIGSTEARAAYLMSQWNKKYNEKIRKGYVDTTHLREKKQVPGQPDEYKPIPDEESGRSLRCCAMPLPIQSRRITVLQRPQYPRQ